MAKIFTQQYIAKAVGVNTSWINFIINGRKHASWHLAKRIGKITGSDATIWVDAADDAAEKRQLAILKAELLVRGNKYELR